MENATFSDMDIAAIEEFPFVEAMPKRAKSRMLTLWDDFNEIKNIQSTHGMLVPDTIASTLLEVSRQRVAELCDEGKLHRIKWKAHNYVSENSLVELCRTERKAGRPQKVINECGTSLTKAFKVAQSIAKK